VEKFQVVGTSYGGMVAYNLAKMLGEERVEKVVIASSGVNMKRSNNVALVQRAELDKIEDLLLPATPQQLRKLMSLSIYNSPQFLPHFLLNDFLHVTSLCQFSSAFKPTPPIDHSTSQFNSYVD